MKLQEQPLHIVLGNSWRLFMKEIWLPSIIFIDQSPSYNKPMAQHTQKDTKVYLFVFRIDPQTTVIIICEGRLKIEPNTSNILKVCMDIIKTMPFWRFWANFTIYKCSKCKKNDIKKFWVSSTGRIDQFRPADPGELINSARLMRENSFFLYGWQNNCIILNGNLFTMHTSSV